MEKGAIFIGAIADSRYKEPGISLMAAAWWTVFSCFSCYFNSHFFGREPATPNINTLPHQSLKKERNLHKFYPGVIICGSR
jgi:hypothetical protein